VKSSSLSNKQWIDLSDDAVNFLICEVIDQFITVLVANKVIKQRLQDHQQLMAVVMPVVGRGGGTPCSGLYGEAPPKRGAFFYKLTVYLRVVYESVTKSPAK